MFFYISLNMNLLEYIQSQTHFSEIAIQNTLNLLGEGCTIPFIARYRKDKTQNLDEIAIETIQKKNNDFEAICKRKQSILESISEQGKLTTELEEKINNSFNINELEDLYLPYKKRRKTRADQAKENGLEPLAKIIMSQKNTNLEQISQKFISKNVPDSASALQGASDIIAEWINENLYIRNGIRRIFRRNAQVQTQVAKGQETEETAQKYQQYFNHNEALYRIPSHRLLAILRAENEGVIKLKIEIPIDDALCFIEKSIIKNQNQTSDFLQKTIKDSYKRLLEPSISNEILQEAKEKADDKAIAIFSENLTQLLLSSPLGEKRILAIDPGFKTGCKVVCLNEQGDFLHYETIFIHTNSQEIQARKSLEKLVQKFDIQAIAIGNGTASRETESFVKSISFGCEIPIFIVNEAGASVYSASKIAREEFPNHDVTIRGAISIGRRLADPLAELVKIEPKSIGVGQYQHDVNQKKLKEELDNVVIRCVNKVGVNLNTAGKSLLSYVSGIGEKMAENIVAYRTKNGAFKTREELKNIPRFSEKTFQQAVAFLRIHQGENPLDNSAIHPESYSIVLKMAKDLGVNISELIGNKSLIEKININSYINETNGILYLTDVLKELEKPGIDPRKNASTFEFDSSIKTIDDLKIGMILNGIVNNITAFGCFVNIGIKESGLVHISQLKSGFVSDVNEVVKLNQQVSVKITNVDTLRKRIDLTMIF